MLRDLTGEERAAYFRGILPIWGGGLGDERFQQFQRRLADAPEAQDRYRLLGWFEGGALVAALKAYDLHASCAGRRLRLLGIGAVFTPPPLRRRGHAAAMLRAAIEEYRQRGAHAALLFSDIDVGYYERLGFHQLESRECSVDAASLPVPRGSFRAAMAGDEDRMSEIFAAARDGERRFGLVRDGWTLRFQLRRLRELARARGVGEPEWGVLAEGRGGDGAAMIRFGRDTVDVLEAAWSSDSARECLMGALRDCLLRTGRLRLRFWPAGQLRGLFRETSRGSAIAMLAPLDPSVHLPGRGAPAELALLDHI
jgi:predicted N-acetyltransferase YhbS